jgi:hypothetical protein
MHTRCPERVTEAVQQRLDKNPQVMRVRRETAKHPPDTLKMRIGVTHFLMKRPAEASFVHELRYQVVGDRPRDLAVCRFGQFVASSRATVRSRRHRRACPGDLDREGAVCQ